MIAAALGASVSASVAVIAEMTPQIAALERQLAADFEPHPDAEVVRSLPGLGTVLGARVPGEFGDAPDRYRDAKSRRNYAGTSPIARHPPGRAGPARPQQAARRRDLPLGVLRARRQSRRPELLRRPPRRRRHPHQALRALGNRLVGILHGCLASHTRYGETTAWAHRASQSAPACLTLTAVGCLVRQRARPEIMEVIVQRS